MAVMQEKSAQEILLEQLAKRVADLTAQQKAKESSIKDINDRQKIAEENHARSLAVMQAEYEKKAAQLKVDIAPLQDKKSECILLESRIAQLKQQALDAAASVRASKNVELQGWNDKIAKASARLETIEKSIADNKAKVANI